MRHFRPSPDNHHEPELRFLYVAGTCLDCLLAVRSARNLLLTVDGRKSLCFLCCWCDRFDAFGYMKHSRPAVFRQCDGQPGEFVNTRKGVYVVALSLLCFSCWLRPRCSGHCLPAPGVFEVHALSALLFCYRYHKNVRAEFASLVCTPAHAPFQDGLAFTRSLGDFYLHTFGANRVCGLGD